MTVGTSRPAGVVIGIIAATALLLAACNAKTETLTESCGPVVPKTAWDGLDTCVLESQVRSQLAKEAGRPIPPVTCPDELDAELNASTVCTYTDTDGTYNVTVTVTDIEWGKVILDDGTPGNFVSGNATLAVNVADKPNPR